MVTSRDQALPLIATQGAAVIYLDLLSPKKATDLLGSRIGAARLSAEPDAASALVGHCAGLPAGLDDHHRVPST